MARDHIFISELRVECIVGLYTRERVEPQPLLVDVELGLDTSEAARSGRIAASCDYARVADEITAMLEHRRYKLLELAADELAAMLLGVHPLLVDVRVRLTKPEALRGRAHAAGVEIRRSAEDRSPTRVEASFGHFELLHGNAEAQLCLVHVEPGRSLPAGLAGTLAWIVDEPGNCVVLDERPRANEGERRQKWFCCAAGLGDLLGAVT